MKEKDGSHNDDQQNPRILQVKMHHKVEDFVECFEN